MGREQGLSKKDFNMGLKNKLLLLSAVIVFSTHSASAINADFTCFDSNSSKQIHLINPIYLKPTSPLKNDKQENVLNNSENIVPISEKVDSEIKDDFSQNNSPQETVNKDFFAPPNKQDNDYTLEPINQTVTDSNTYSVQVDTSSDVDYEGKLISEIEIDGLNIINEDFVYKNIKTEIGSYFNKDLLQQDLQKIYMTGFFTEQMTVEPFLLEDGSVKLKFELEENTLVSDVSVVGNSVISTTELMPLVISLKDKPQNILNINNTIENIVQFYQSRGYILANVSSIDDDENGNLIFNINEGVINKIKIDGNEKTKDYVIERNILTQPGTVYNENYLKEDLARIYSTKIFKEVNRDIVPSAEFPDKYDINVIVKEDSSNNFSIGGGIDNALGAFGSIGFSENNFLGRAQRVSLSGILGSGILLSDASIKNRMNYQLELNFFEPHFINADNSLLGKLYYRDLGSFQIPLAIERRFGLSVGIEHKVRGFNNLSTTMSTGFENISLKEGDFDKISALYAKNNLDIGERAKQLSGGFFWNFTPGIKYSTLDNEEIPRNGVIANAKFIEAVSFSDIKATNGRLAGGITKYFPVLKKSSFSLTARGGLKVHGDDMPEVMAFRLGGPYTVRGFKMNGVGTGEAFVMGSAELATPIPFSDRIKWDFFQKIRLTFFVDAGHIFDPTISSVLYDRPNRAITAGVGLKVYVPGVGPISVDYGIPITNPGDYGSKNGYFTFGTGVNGIGW